MFRFWPWIVAACGLGVIVTDYVMELNTLVYFEGAGLPLSIDAGPSWLLGFLGLAQIVVGIAAGVDQARSATKS
jgi:hypothetical protein